jgi:NAD(P)-dependent dehydrogenase (short-subunit alcohol dehydrogenase family)
LQLGPDNIRVNAIAPGIIATDASRFLVEDPKIAETMTGQTPLRRFGAPDDIAGCAVFLAAPAGRYACGQVFLIDGGQLLDGTQAVRQIMGTGM